MANGSGVKRFFTSHWEKIALWGILIGLFYLLKPFFLLIFLTFLITYATKSAAEWIAPRVRLGYRPVTVLVFVFFVAMLGAVGIWITPRLVAETNQVLTTLAGDGENQTSEKVDRFVESIVVRVFGDVQGHAFIGSTGYSAVMETLKDETAKAFKSAMPDMLAALLRLVKLGWELLVALLLAIIFSFILVMDWRRIAESTRKLDRSRVRTFYIGAAPHLQAFAGVLGKAFRAQAIIAACNTVLTGVGLWLFDVPNVVLLSAIVFLCGFVPILGTFLSSVPILLFGVQAGGLALVLKLVVLIGLVHAFEAYILNPRITAGVLHAHPIVVLMLLLAGERFFGAWGLVVGVPIGCYVISVLTTCDDGGADGSAGDEDDCGPTGSGG